MFVNDIDRCYRLRLFLEQFGIKSCVLNAELPQNSRYHIVQEFNRGIYDYIIATDEGELMEDPDEAAGNFDVLFQFSLVPTNFLSFLFCKRNGRRRLFQVCFVFYFIFHPG